MKITRATTATDYRYIAGLYNPANNRYFVSKKMTVKRLREKPSHDFICLVAGKRIGWFRLLPHEHNPRHATVVLIIDQPHQGKGYGRQAMQGMETKARDLGYRRLLLRVMPENEPAMRLYQKCGFKPQYTLAYMMKPLTKG